MPLLLRSHHMSNLTTLATDLDVFTMLGYNNMHTLSSFLKGDITVK